MECSLCKQRMYPDEPRGALYNGVPMTTICNSNKWHALCGDLGLTDDPSITSVADVHIKLNEKQEQYAAEKTAGLQRDLTAARRISIINAQAREIVNLRQESWALQGRNERQEADIWRMLKTIEELKTEAGEPRVIVFKDPRNRPLRELADMVRGAVQK
jgi:hypothetical protein